MKTAKNPESLTLGELIAMPLYRAEIVNVLNDVHKAKRKAQLVADYRYTSLKRQGTDRLSDKGLLNADDLIMLYPQVIAKVAKNLSANERSTILSICDIALHNTLLTLKKQYEIDCEKNAAGENN